MRIESFPFPARNPAFTDDMIFYIKNESDDKLHYYYNKSVSSDAVTIANQFFLIEEMLLDSFQFVSPIKRNSDTCSVKFATIVRESSNLFEIICRKLYSQTYLIDSSKNITVYNFLTLDALLNLTAEKVRAPLLESYLTNGEKIEPFGSLNSWSREEKIKDENIPSWWTAYNKIKHDTESVNQYATLNNAIYSTSAVFVLIRKVYGDGLISGFLRKPHDTEPGEISLYQIKTSNLFIGELLKTSKKPRFEAGSTMNLLFSPTKDNSH